MPGGLLDGKPLVYKSANTYLLTDNDPNTSLTTTYKTEVTFTSSVGMDIEKYYFDYKNGSGGGPEVEFFDSSGKSLYAGTSGYNTNPNNVFASKVLKTLDAPIKNVVKIVLYNKTSFSVVLNEFEVYGSTNLERPMSVKVTPGIRKATVDFIAPSGATGYYLYLNGLKTDYLEGTSYEINNLLPDVPYTVQLSADYKGNESPLTDAIKVVPLDDLVIPVLAAVPDWNKITLSWNKPDNITKYFVYVNGSKRETTTMPYVISNLFPETDYEIRIEYTDKYGRILQSDLLKVKTKSKPDDIEPPDKPTGLKAAMSQDYLSILVSWAANKEEDFAGYNLYLSDNGSDFKKINTSKNTTYTLTKIDEEHKYTFKLEAFDESGNVSDPAETTITTPKKSTDSEQENTNEYILVTWTETPGAVGYLIYLNGKQVGNVGPNVFEYKITKEMGYRPGQLINETSVKAVFADGSTGGSNNGGGNGGGSEGGNGGSGHIDFGFDVSEIWKNAVSITKQIGPFILLGIAIFFVPYLINLIYVATLKYKARRGNS